VRRLAGRIEDDQGDAPAGQLGLLPFGQFGEHRDDTGRAAGEHLFGPRPARGQRPLHLGEHDGQFVLAGDTFDPADDLQGPEAFQGVEDQFEDRGRRVGVGAPVAVPADYRLDPLAGVEGDP
jgi:hypothetical protein